MQPLETKTIDVRVSHRQTRPQHAKVTADGLFAIHVQHLELPNQRRRFEFWTITHVPSGLSLSHDHMSEAEARAVLAVWQALPLPWQRKTAPPIVKAQKQLPPQLRAWIQAIRKKG